MSHYYRLVLLVYVIRYAIYIEAYLDDIFLSNVDNYGFQ